MTFAQLKEFDAVITDKKPPQKYIDYLENNNVKFYYNSDDTMTNSFRRLE